MRKQKMIIGILSMFLSIGAFAQDETDDMYFFESDVKKVNKKEITSQPLGSDQSSSLSKFSNPDFAGGDEIDTDTYTPTYNYYDSDFSNYNNGIQSGFASRNGWARGGFYASPIYNRWGNGFSALDCPPYGASSSFGWSNNYNFNRSTAFWDCPPFGSNSTVSVTFGRSYYNSARWNTPFRNFNSWNNWSYNNIYCPPSAYGNSVATQVRNSQNTVRAVRSNRSSRNYNNTTRSPRNYATRSIAQNSRRSVSRSGRSVSGTSRTSSGRLGSGYSSGSRSSSYSRSRSSYSSGRSSSGSRSSYNSGRSSSGSRSTFSSGRSSSGSRSSSVRSSSSGSRSSGSRSSSSRSSSGTRKR